MLKKGKKRKIVNESLEVMKFLKETSKQNEEFFRDIFKSQQQIEAAEREKDRKFLLDLATLLKPTSK